MVQLAEDPVSQSVKSSIIAFFFQVSEAAAAFLGGRRGTKKVDVRKEDEEGQTDRQTDRQIIQRDKREEEGGKEEREKGGERMRLTERDGEIARERNRECGK